MKWYHNDVVMGTGVKAGDYQYQLVIENIQPEQAGRYKCVAENDAGVATCTAHLVVQQQQQQVDISEESFVSSKAVFSQSSTVFTSSQENNTFRSVSRQVEQSISKVSGQAAAQEVIQLFFIIQRLVPFIFSY